MSKPKRKQCHRDSTHTVETCPDHGAYCIECNHLPGTTDPTCPACDWEANND